MTSSVINMAAILKQLYPSGLPKDATYKDNPFLALIPKKTDFEGEVAKGPLKYAPNSGRSSSFSSAQSNLSNVKNVAFLYTRASDYAVARVKNELILASKNNAGAFISALKQEMESAQQDLSNSAAQALFGNGAGVIGQLAASTTLASTSLPLRNPEDVVFFEVGRVIRLSAANDGSGSVRAGSLTVTAVDRNTGVLTVNANISTAIATATVNDYISIDGDYGVKMTGFDGWVPLTAPSATPFFGVDRTIDAQRLAGCRGDLSAYPIEEAMIRAGKEIAKFGGKTTHVFLGYEKYADLINSLGSKVQYVDVVAQDANVGFKGVKVYCGNNLATVLPDRNCASNTMKMVNMETWLAHSLGGFPMILDMDGLKTLRVSNDDALEIRMGYYAQYFCNWAGSNGNYLV